MCLLKLGCREALTLVLKSGTMKSFQNQGLSTLCTGLRNTFHYEGTMLLQGFSVRTVEIHPYLNLPSTSIITIAVTIVIIWCTGWIYYMPFQFPSPLARQKKNNLKLNESLKWMWLQWNNARTFFVMTELLSLHIKINNENRNIYGLVSNYFSWYNWHPCERQIPSVALYLLFLFTFIFIENNFTIRNYGFSKMTLIRTHVLNLKKFKK